MNPRLLLIIGGGIAAYKCPEMVRRARDAGFSVRCVLTEAASQFVTPLALGSVSGDKVFGDLFSLTDEHEMGHIRLARDADLVVVAPATADLMAKAANGLANDLASTILMATDLPVLMAPAMNPVMWQNKATQRNLEQLRQDGVSFVGPASGDMACGEEGAGRMSEPLEIIAAAQELLGKRTQGPSDDRRLVGIKALVTSGPTHEPIDPVRYIANRSSGKQGHAIAQALQEAGAEVTLVSGPVALPDPVNVNMIHVQSAKDMLDACLQAGKVHVAIFAAAVADWRVAQQSDFKLKKQDGAPATLQLEENPDILATIAKQQHGRPDLVIGFAAETGDLERKAMAKRKRKGCDWIVANDVAAGDGVFGSDRNSVLLIDSESVERWQTLDKSQVASKLADKIADHLDQKVGQ